MDFSLNTEQQMLQETARRFAQTELPAHATDIENDNSPYKSGSSQTIRRNGLYGDQFTICLWWGWAWAFRGCIDFGGASKNFCRDRVPRFEASFGPALAIAHFAPKALQQRILPQVCSGEMVVAVSMSEPHAGTALTDLKTSGKLSGDKIILNGSKRWCSGGGHAMLFIAACLMIQGPRVLAQYW